MRSKISERELGSLAEAMLRAVVSGEPLPGHKEPTSFPDLAHVLNQPNVIVVKENLPGLPAGLKLSKPVKIVSRQWLRQHSAEHGDVVYLEFQPPQIQGDSVQLTLAAKIARRDPHQPLLGLSGLNVTFKKAGRKWQALKETRAFAA